MEYDITSHMVTAWMSEVQTTWKLMIIIKQKASKPITAKFVRNKPKEYAVHLKMKRVYILKFKRPEQD